MSNKKLTFVNFSPENDHFTVSFSLDGFWSMDGDPNAILEKARRAYSTAINEMQRMVLEIETYREKRKPIPARKIWHLGDKIYKLKVAMENLSLEINDLYAHLVRDLGVKRKWLEKVIILKTQLPHFASFHLALRRKSLKKCR